jgi:hypothetical protein
MNHRRQSNFPRGPVARCRRRGHDDPSFSLRPSYPTPAVVGTSGVDRRWPGGPARRNDGTWRRSPHDPFAPPAWSVRSAPTAGRIAGTVSREGRSPSVGCSVAGPILAARVRRDGAVSPPGCDRGGRRNCPGQAQRLCALRSDRPKRYRSNRPRSCRADARERKERWLTMPHAESRAPFGLSERIRRPYNLAEASLASCPSEDTISLESRPRLSHRVAGSRRLRFPISSCAWGTYPP